MNRGQTRLLSLTIIWIGAVTVTHQFGTLINHWFLYVLLLCAVVMCFWFKRHLTFLCVAVALLGVSYTQLRADFRLQQKIPQNWIGQTRIVTGTISSIPLRTPFGVRFILMPSLKQSDQISQKAFDDGLLPNRIATSWYSDDLPHQSLRVGQEWRLPLGLKPMRATQNEGVFDQEQLWWANNIRAMATVRVNRQTALLDYPTLIDTQHNVNTWFENTRMSALDQIEVALSQDGDTSAIFKALTFGEQSDISSAQWALFQQTGITHLISISGMHISMLAILMAWLVNVLWRQSARLCGLMPALYAAQWAGLFLALIYALLAGWALPAQRTVYMLALWLFLTRIGVAHSAIRVVCFALWMVVLFDPFTVLTIGFWLSFGAVLWLILAFDVVIKSNFNHKWQQMVEFVASHLAIGMAMLPITLYFFHQASLLGVLINFIAIPLVSVVLVPLMLLSSILYFISGWAEPIHWVNQLLAWSIQGLQYASNWFPQPIWVRDMPLWLAFSLTVLALFLVLSVRHRFWFRTIGSSGTIIVLLLLPHATQPIAKGQMQVHVIDVGQGNAVLLQTATQNWLYDTGPRYTNDNDAGARLIVPYLRAHGVSYIDVMVLSHNDADHTGGAASIAQVIPVGEVLTSMSREAIDALNIKAEHFIQCEQNQKIEVNSVFFQILSPNKLVLADINNGDNTKSCVLRIDTNNGEWQSMLLTGDIDGLREAQLVVSPEGGVRDWAVDVLMVPHHGSGTSSTAPLIEATHPKMVFIQAGYLNTFHHPLSSVVERYQHNGVNVQETVDTGTLRFCLGCEQASMVKWRDVGWRYWWWLR